MGTEETRVTHIRCALDTLHRTSLCGEKGQSISFEHYYQSFYDNDKVRREAIKGHINRIPEHICKNCIKQLK